jgi:hypothetical protein
MYFVIRITITQGKQASKASKQANKGFLQRHTLTTSGSVTSGLVWSQVVTSGGWLNTNTLRFGSCCLRTRISSVSTANWICSPFTTNSMSCSVGRNLREEERQVTLGFFTWNTVRNAFEWGQCKPRLIARLNTPMSFQRIWSWEWLFPKIHPLRVALVALQKM